MEAMKTVDLQLVGPYEGKLVTLRRIVESDVSERYLGWLRDPEVIRFLKSGRGETSIEDIRKFCRGMIASGNNVLFAIIANDSGLHIGNIKLGGIDWYHRFADLGILLGDRDYWGKGCGREACQLLLQCAFDTLELNKVILGVHEQHQAARKLYEKIGFSTEGAIANLLRLDDSYFDKIFMGIDKITYESNHSPKE